MKQARSRRIMLLAITLAAIAPTSASHADTRPGDLNALSLEVAALQTLHDLELSQAQLAAFIKLAHEAAPTAADGAEGKASPAYGKALGELRDALARGDDEQIATCRDKLDALHEKEEPELDLQVEVTDAARARALPALRILKAPQVAAFLASVEVADPGDLLVDGLEQVRGLSEAEQKDETSRLAAEVSWLVAGRDEKAGAKVRDRVTALLEQASAAKDEAAFQKEHAALEREARAIAGPVDPLAVLARSLEHKMAELLSNPRLESALTTIKTRPSARPRITKKAP
ncbi:MAG TPA: hypothetical protein VGY58_12725 [Gemmataceae bacterium]|jgi:hypothetical protein|nr:hypothetical protein [Gemmataceae bacterium]